MRPALRGPVLALAVCAACGSAADAVDADPIVADAGPPPDARVETITAIVLTETFEFDVHGFQVPAGVPRPDTDVYFIEPGNLVHRVVTDAAGVATSPPVVAGTSMIVVRERTGFSDFALTIYRQLEPGETITVGPASDKPPLGWLAESMVVQFPPLAAADSYRVASPCPNNSFQTDATTWSVNFQTECDATDRTIVIWARDAGGDLIGYTTRQVDIASGAIITMPAFQPVPTFVANLSTIDGLRTLVLEGTYRDRPDDVGPPVEVPSPLYNFFEQVDDSNSGTVVHVPVAPAGDQFVLVVRMDPSDTQSSPTWLSRTFDLAVTSTRMDLGGRLPFVTQSSIDAENAAIEWVETAGRRADAVVVGGTYFVPVGGFGQLAVSYRMYGPHNPGQLQFPPIPSEIDQISPRHATGEQPLMMYLIDDVGRPSYRSVVPTIDADSRSLTRSSQQQFGDARDVWFSGSGSM